MIVGLVASLVLFGDFAGSAAAAQLSRTAQLGQTAQLAEPGPVPVDGGALPVLSLAELLPDSERFHPDVMAQVVIEPGPTRTLVTQLTQSYLERDLAEDQRVTALRDRAELLVDRWGHRVVLDSRRAAEGFAALAEAEAHDNVGLYGVSTFVGNVELDLAKFALNGVSSPVPELTDSAEEALTQRLASDRATLAARRLGLADAERTAAEIDAAIDEASGRLVEAEAAKQEAERRVAELAPAFERALVLQTIAGTDLPIVVIDAYYSAQVTTAATRPSCRVTWDQLAGIGLIETRHGSFGGSSVGRDGRTSRQILGPVLNGDPFAAIADTDGGALDGDVEWDRAVGPMQFIPGSWKIYGQDGNGDGVKDPHNVYDAALAAAEHLCRSRNGLDADGNFRTALLGYNRSGQYGSDVMAARSRYRGLVELAPPPVVGPDNQPVTSVGETGVG